jgi:hypothetical protein
MTRAAPLDRAGGHGGDNASLAGEFSGMVDTLKLRIPKGDQGKDLNSQVHSLFTTGQLGQKSPDTVLDAEELSKLTGMSKEAAERFINAADTDGTKTALTEGELVGALKYAQGEQAPGESGGSGGGEQAGSGEQAGGAGNQSGSFSLLLSLLDKNGDGKISKDELTEFDKTGPDGKPDGKLDKEELAAAVKAAAEAKGLKYSDEQIGSMLANVDATLTKSGGKGMEAGLDPDQLTDLLGASTDQNDS